MLLPHRVDQGLALGDGCLSRTVNRLEVALPELLNLRYELWGILVAFDEGNEKGVCLVCLRGGSDGVPGEGDGPVDLVFEGAPIDLRASKLGAGWHIDDAVDTADQRVLDSAAEDGKEKHALGIPGNLVAGHPAIEQVLVGNESHGRLDKRQRKPKLLLHVRGLLLGYADGILRHALRERLDARCLNAVAEHGGCNLVQLIRGGTGVMDDGA